MYNIILALVLTCSLGGIVYLFSHKQKTEEANLDTKTEETVSEVSDGDALKSKVAGLLSNLKVKREVLEGITEKGLRRLRVFVLRVDNQLVDSIGKLKEDKASPYADNGRITALINTQQTVSVDEHETTITTVTEEVTQTENQTDTSIWSLERDYLNHLNNQFDIETLTKLIDLYSDIGDLSAIRGILLKAVNNDLSWDDIINDSRLVESFKKLAEKEPMIREKKRTIRKSISPKIHQRRTKTQVES